MDIAYLKGICEKEVIHSCVDHPVEAEIDKIDPDEFKSDKIVHKVVLSSVTEPIEDKLNVEKEVLEKFSAIRVNVVIFSDHANRRGKCETGVATISWVNLNKIWGRRLGLKNCCVIECTF